MYNAQVCKVQKTGARLCKGTHRIRKLSENIISKQSCRTPSGTDRPSPLRSIVTARHVHCCVSLLSRTSVAGVSTPSPFPGHLSPDKCQFLTQFTTPPFFCPYLCTPAATFANKSHIKMAVSRLVAQCSMADVYQRFRCLYCLHHQGDDGGSTDL
jgi:hypothetical protein